MMAQNLKDMFSAIGLLGLLVAPILIIVAALIGLGIYAIMEDRETALWICGLAFGTSVVLGPIAFNILAKPKYDSGAR